MAIQKLSQAQYVERGYAQVEPQFLEAQRTGKMYAQYPADASINVLENGQYVKYDATTGTLKTTAITPGEWMMVFNEVKLYGPREQYEDFAMIKQNYNARIYSPVGQKDSTLSTISDYSGEARREGSNVGYKVQVPALQYPAAMPEGTKMVPRAIKTYIGDRYTTNAVNETTLNVGDLLTPAEGGFLAKAGASSADMQWQVVKVYTLADNQKAVKLQRIK